MNFEKWWKTTAFYHLGTSSQSAKAAWEYRQAQIDELQSQVNSSEVIRARQDERLAGRFAEVERLSSENERLEKRLDDAIKDLAHYRALALLLQDKLDNLQEIHHA